MRPLKLIISAFGPYAGKVEIPLSELGESGLYLICGDTGAGKTTIFDGICYALFGEASGGAGKGGRETKSLRSDFADPDTETYVELDFEYRDQIHHLRRNPEYERPKKRGEGMTKQVAAVEYVRPDGLVLTREGEVKSAIEGLLGVNRNQFSQIAMIAQGEFRKLLVADTKDRSAILRKLFDTSIYERFAKNLENQKSLMEQSHKKAVSQITQAAESAVFPEDSPDEIERARLFANNAPLGEWLNKALTQQLREDTNTEADLVRAKDVASAAKDEANKQLSQSRTLAENRIQLANEKKVLEGLLGSIPKLKEASERAHAQDPKAAELDALALNLNGALPAYQEVEQLKRELEQEKAKLALALEEGKKKKATKESIESRLLDLKKDANALGEAAAEVEAAKACCDKADAQLDAAKKELERINDVERLEAALVGLQKEQGSLETACFETQQDLKTSEDRLSELTELAESLLGATQAFFDAQTALRQAKERKAEQRQRIRDLEKIACELRKEEDAHKSACAALMERKTELDSQRRSFARIEDLRTQEKAGLLAEGLQPETPCPVCGSTNHPALATLPEAVPTAEEFDKAKARVDQAQQAYEKAGNKAAAANARKESAKKNLDAFVNEHGDEQFLQQILVSLDEAEAKAEQDLAQATQKNDALKKTQADQKKAQQNKDLLTSKLSKQKEGLAKKNAEIKETGAHLEASRKELDGASRKEVLTKLEKTQAEAKEALKRLSDAQEKRKKHEKLSAEIAQTEEDLKSSDKQLEQQRTLYQETMAAVRGKEGRIQAQVGNLPFPTMQEAIEKLDAATKEAADIKAKTKQADAELERAQKGLAETQGKIGALESSLENAPVIDEGEQLKILANAEKKLEKTEEGIKNVDFRLRTNRQARDKLKRALAAYQDIESRFGQIQELADVASGKLTGKARISFETYVQGIYFDQIIAAANHRLSMLANGRYELERHKSTDRSRGQTGLDLDVMDHYTGKARAATSLSGGESFQASLCLALGLADVVQAHAGGVQLETMFIDEGFGSLDSEALNAAMNMLSSLSSENKLIGIISHVEDLKQGIDRKIVVTRSPRGSEVHMEL